MHLMVEEFLADSMNALVFAPGRDGRPVARIGRIVVLPAHGERVQIGAPYRPARLIDRGRFLLAVGLRPSAWPRSATVRDGHAVGVAPQATNATAPFKVPLAEPVPDGTPVFGDFTENGGRVVFCPARCACGQFAAKWVAGRPMCPACADAWWQSRPIPANDRDGGGFAFCHDVEGDE